MKKNNIHVYHKSTTKQTRKLKMEITIVQDIDKIQIQKGTQDQNFSANIKENGD